MMRTNTHYTFRYILQGTYFKSSIVFRSKNDRIPIVYAYICMDICIVLDQTLIKDQIRYFHQSCRLYRNMLDVFYFCSKNRINNWVKCYNKFLNRLLLQTLLVGGSMNNRKTIEIEVPNYFCKDCECKDKITEIAIKELITQG